MIRALLLLVWPFHSIARELRILRELYELDLASRNPPIYRLTEQPSAADTEVSYMDVEEPKRKRETVLSRFGWPKGADEPAEEEE